MNPSRLEAKVGLFVFIGLVLLVALLLAFSKGVQFFHPGYEILLRAHTVGGLKPRAQVLMSGVQVGTVSAIQLAPDGKSVVITLQIRRPYRIYKDARFLIEQSGFLGDQYVAIRPTLNEGATFASGEEAKAEAPLDMQEIARTTAGLLVHIDAAATNLDAALLDVRHTILSTGALTNLSSSFDEFHKVSERSLDVAANLDALVETNRHAVSVTLSNLLFFSQQINQSAGTLRDLLATNSPAIEATVSNLNASSVTLRNLLDGVQAGKGLAGKLLENEQIASNVSQIASNLSITTSNLNRLGLWGILWQHKPPRTKEPAPAHPVLTSPKNPFEE